MVSSVAHANGTQSLLRAVGVGGRRSIPGVAALNWVVKDGLGRLGKLGYAAGYGRTFDSDLKVPTALLVLCMFSEYQCLFGIVT